MVVFGLLALTIISIYVCHSLAKSRGANPIFWGTMGALFGPFAIPFVFLSKPAR
jgi:hypothetical protein